MTFLFPLIGDLIADLETIVRPDEVDLVKSELQRGADELDGGTFQNLHVSEAVFGAFPRGVDLGQHHVRAHTVISETIEGVIQDLRDFRDGVVKAEQLLADADAGAAADLHVREEAVAALEDANRWFAGDHRYEDARNGRGDRG